MQITDGKRLCHTCGFPERYHGQTVLLPDGGLRRVPPARLLAGMAHERWGLGTGPLICSDYMESPLVEGVL
jgi:hypothetical protein